MIENIRTTLIITLSILMVIMAVRRFKRYIKMHHTPVPQHVELVTVEVMYHPSQLRVQVSMPAAEEVFPAMLSHEHAPLRTWPAVQVSKGDHTFELPLSEDTDGTYFFEIATSSQRTERKFIVRRT